MTNLKLGSLFDGSGGFPLGGLLSGITPVWASEVEPFARRVTTKRLPFMKHYGDISTMDGGKIEPVDIITFGSPCQDMSVAGKRNGLDGERSGLFYEAVRIIKEMRKATNGKFPRYIVWENVPGAFSSNSGRDFKAVLEAVIGIAEENAEVPMPEKGWPYADLYMGNEWSVAYRTLDSQYWGVPQRRRRIFLVGDFGGRSAGNILFKSEGLSRYSKEGFRAWQRAANNTEDSFGAPGLGTDGTTLIGIENHPNDGRVKIEEEDKIQTLSSRMGTGGNNVPLVLKIRSGCEGGGKGALIQTDKSATLACNNDQTVFVPNTPSINVPCNWDGKQVTGALTTKNAGGNQRMPDKDNFNCVLQPFGISSKDSNSMKSSNPHSGIYKAETSRCLDANGGNPACNQGGIAVVEEKPVYSLTMGSFAVASKETAPTLLSRDYKDPSVVTDPSFGIGRDAYNQGQNAKFNPSIEEELQPTLVAKGPGAVAAPYGFDPSASRDLGQYFLEDCGNTVVNGTCPGHHNGVLENGYTVRRLTPCECARLQGFPDWWCRGLDEEEPTDADIQYWKEVWETYAKVIGGCKPKTEKQVKKWLMHPHSDAAEYKLWGNGVTLPCVFFVLAGLVYYTQNEG